MNRRLQQFLAAENISQSQFADEIGVARASISHILAGRNKPGFDFIESMARHYPTLNLEWLVLGSGKMYKTATEATPAPVQEHFTPVEKLFADEVETAAIELATGSPSPAPEPQPTERNTLRNKAQSIKGQRNISRIVIFYDDNTYQELK